jgi:hypothetical protein
MPQARWQRLNISGTGQQADQAMLITHNGSLSILVIL